MRCYFFYPLVAVFGLATLLGCERESSDTEGEQSQSVEKTEPLETVDPEQQQATLAAWKQGTSWLATAREQCTQMHDHIDRFLAQPDAETMAHARDQWRSCHNHWHRMDTLLALSASNPGLFGSLERMIFDIEARPLQPGYLDALQDYPYSGIVNDITLNINARTLREQHGLTDASDVSLGLHALEFLLWGEAGQRPASDYEPQARPDEAQQQAELTTDKLPRNRRRELLRLLSHLLQDDLETLEQLWHNERSTLWLTYQQLPPTSRLELLKNAARELLEQQLPADLNALLDSEQAHNPFAGDNLEPVTHALKGLRELMTEGEPALAQWLGDESTTAQWLEQLDELIAMTEQSSPETNETDANELNPEALIQQLQLLSVFLQPVASLPNN